MQKYAVYSTLIQRFPSSWSFQFFLRYCKDPDAEKRKASPCRFHAIYRTASGLQTSGGRFAGVSGTLCGHGISCNAVGNLEWAPFSACSIFWLISARYDSFVHIRSKNRHVWFPDGEFCFCWVFVFIFQENTLRCFASKCAKWKDTKSDAIALTWEKLSKQKAVKLYTITYSNIYFCLLAIRGCRYVRYVSKWFKMLLQHVAFFALQVEEVGLALDVLMRTSAVNERNIWIIW